MENYVIVHDQSMFLQPLMHLSRREHAAQRKNCLLTLFILDITSILDHCSAFWIPFKEDFYNETFNGFLAGKGELIISNKYGEVSFIGPTERNF
jgi:hypothetical protein